MAGYRRFVAYVYEYRRGKKDVNCGFIRVEVRDQRCKIEIHLHCPGLPPSVECGVYGFVRNRGLMDASRIGICRTGDGAVEHILETDAQNMGGSGVPLGAMGGMILRTESGAFFGTEWDDQNIRPENFRQVWPDGGRPSPTEAEDKDHAEETGKDTVTEERKDQMTGEEEAEEAEDPEIRQKLEEEIPRGVQEPGDGKSMMAGQEPEQGESLNAAWESGEAEGLMAMHESEEEERAEAVQRPKEAESVKAMREPEEKKTLEPEEEECAEAVQGLEKGESLKVGQGLNEKKSLKARQKPGEEESLKAVRESGEEEILKAVQESGRAESVKIMKESGEEEILKAVQESEEEEILKAVQESGGAESVKIMQKPGEEESLKAVQESGEEEILKVVQESGGAESVKIMQKPGEEEILRAVQESEEEEILNAGHEPEDVESAEIRHESEREESPKTAQDPVPREGYFQEISSAEGLTRQPLSEAADAPPISEPERMFHQDIRPVRGTQSFKGMRDRPSSYSVSDAALETPVQLTQTAGTAASACERLPGESCDPFSDGFISDCRKIKMEDLRLLNMRDRSLGGNRFLQHGYYHFGHLLLGKNSSGGYILGVPGSYDQQERFMAGMFGFPYFRYSPQVSVPGGRGGYWYRSVNSPNFH